MVDHWETTPFFETSCSCELGRTYYWAPRLPTVRRQDILIGAACCCSMQRSLRLFLNDFLQIVFWCRDPQLCKNESTSATTTAALSLILARPLFTGQQGDDPAHNRFRSKTMGKMFSDLYLTSAIDLCLRSGSSQPSRRLLKNQGASEARGTRCIARRGRVGR